METQGKLGCQKPLLMGAGIVVILVIATVVFFQIRKKNEIRAQEKKAEEVFSPAISKLAKTEIAPDLGYDIDRTIAVIHGIDQALKEKGTLQEYLRYMSTQDYRNVAPEVLKARQNVLSILKRLYAKQTALENQEATFTVTRTILSTMTLVNADLTLATGIPSLDKEQAKSILKDLRNDQKEREDMLNELTNLETELIGVMTNYSKTYYKYIEEWDKVLIVRDAAYLASAGEDWQAVIEKSEQVVKMAPRDSEARLLGALAHLQMKDAVSSENRHLEKAADLVADYVKIHPSKTAPALLLQAIIKLKSGQEKDAIRLFEQSAAYFPKQSNALSDMLNPYEVRSFLRKSSEGKRIVDLYKSTMLGAGFFSPDLQLAKLYFDKGEFEAGRKKVLDHFSRRRSQNEWDLVLSDVDFCQKFLGADFDAILVEDSHLELLVSPALIGSSINASIKNGSKKDLHNATLVLALQFTDMHRDDFESFKVGETVPIVSGNAETDFGSLDIDFDFLGTIKNKEDIVVNRAVLITDEAVVWVDTDAYKLAMARDSKRTEKQNPKAEVKRKGWFEAMKISPDILIKSLKENMSSEIDLSIGKDDVIFELPKELALLNPIFRLQVGDKLSAPGTNTLGSDKIKLRFENVQNYDSKDANQDAKLIVNSQFGDFEIMLGKNKEKFGLKNIRYISK